jgi:hypothetical protein
VTAKYQVLNTRFPPGDCIARLQKTIEVPPAIQIMRPQQDTYYGRISGTRFRLWVRGPDVWSTGLVLDGFVEGAAQGSTVKFRSRLHPFVTIFMAFWYLGLLSFAVLLGSARLTDPEGFSFHPVVDALLLILMALFGFAVMKGASIMSRPQAVALSRFLSTTLGADDGP